MTQLDRVTGVLGSGTFPTGFYPKLFHACEEQGAQRALLWAGVFDANRAINSNPFNYGRHGIVDVSPDPRQIQSAIGNAGDARIAEANRGDWEPLADSMVLNTIKVLAEAHLADGQALVAGGIKTGHSKVLEHLIAGIHARQDRMHMVGFSTLPEQPTKREQLGDGYELFLNLKRDGVFSTTILVDNKGPFVKKYTLDVQDDAVATLFASVLGAQRFNPRSPSLAEIGKALGRGGSFGGVSIASHRLLPRRQVRGWGAVRKLLSPLVAIAPRGHTPDIGTIFTEAQLATKRALADPSALTIEETIDLKKPFFLVYTIPLPSYLIDEWVALTSQISRWLANTYEKADPIFVSGPGTPPYQGDQGYHLQVSCLFPMPDEPKPIRDLLAQGGPKRLAAPKAKTKKHTLTTNGHGSPSDLARSKAEVTSKK